MSNVECRIKECYLILYTKRLEQSDSIRRFLSAFHIPSPEFQLMKHLSSALYAMHYAVCSMLLFLSYLKHFNTGTFSS